MVSLPLDVALSVLTITSMLMAVQLIIMTVEIVRLRRDVLALMRITSSLNHAVNPWAGEDEDTEPDLHKPPRLRRPGRWGGWFPILPAQPRPKKREP